ncbi:VWA domain-containing protein [Sinorhizobium meliloti]|nr:VWA domain-containing protein [Sinorhizobium meliloti]MDW9389064.1 VWA domain-containing protein [Sinorhizobium meliloti]MDW9546545.1 VWA domain-containing protein [Sinorhizobium meliloti]MDW9603134.1 VWA domain-containing protein [Sinorhizobium meliloti]
MAKKSASVASSANYPHIVTHTWVSSPAIAKGQTADVSVTLTGSSIDQGSPVPAAVVFILDSSGSMEDEGRLDTLKTSVAALIDLLRPGLDLVSLVAFHDSAEVAYPLGDDMAAAKARLAPFHAAGRTNMLAGLQLGIDQWASVPAHVQKKLAILVSDGAPNDANGIAATVQAGVNHHGFVLHTMGIRGFDTTILQAIAAISGGRFVDVSDLSQLQAEMRKIYEQESSILHTVAVRITEELGSSMLRVEPQSCGITILPIGIDRATFEADLAQRYNQFYNTGKMTLPTVPYLGANSKVAYFFSIRAIDSDPLQDIPVDIHGASAVVVYQNGDSGVRPRALDPRQVTILMSGVYLRKQWFELDRRMRISLYNGTSFPIRALTAVDALTNDFSFNDLYKLDQFDPAPDFSLRSAPGVYPRSEICQWHLDRLDAEQEWLINYPVREGPRTPPGSIEIETDDYWCVWLYEMPAFSIRQHQPGYAGFVQDLAGNSLTAPSLALLASLPASSIGQFSPSQGLVSPAPADLVARGFLRQIDFPEADVLSLTQPAPRIGILPRDEFNGRAYVAEVPDGFDIWLEVRHQEQLPVLVTTRDFVPSPPPPP